MAKGSPDCGAVIIGGGPAGLMSACFAAARGVDTVVLEKNGRLGEKLRITGKGRCNLINDCEPRAFLEKIRRGAKFLQSSVYSFSSADIMDFFEKRGLSLVTERGGRVFPSSGDANDVAETLIEAARSSGARFMRGRAVDIETRNGAVSAVILKTGVRISCEAAVICTGGVSYPGTGSTGDGYVLAERLSHGVSPLFASLVPLNCEGLGGELAGLSLKNVELTAQKDGKTVFSRRGEMLFTHFGVSGPLVLTLSSCLAGEDFAPLNIYVDLKPALDRGTLDKRVLRDFSENLNRDFKNSLGGLLPGLIIPEVVSRAGIAPDKKVNAVTSAERAALVDAMKCFRLPAASPRPVEEAVVTAGGVLLSEINPKTMESKKIRNLHFAGEVIDADGYTGGFNLGIAFATGAAAGRNLLRGERQVEVKL